MLAAGRGPHPSGGDGRHMSWRVGLIDSCGIHPKAAAAAAFASSGACVEQLQPAPDPTGHGSRIAALLADDGAPIELLLGQVFLSAMPASAASVAAALDWAVACGARLVHLSLGLAADRSVLRAAVARAVDAGVLVVASMPARGAPVYPAAYPSVIQGTGDARCAPGEISVLGPRLFGGCARPAGGARGGASTGAASVSKALLALPAGTPADAGIDALRSMARHVGRERRMRPGRQGDICTGP